MPIPDYMGLCLNCRARVPLDADLCLVCVRPFLREEARRLAEEENAEGAESNGDSAQKEGVN